MAVLRFYNPATHDIYHYPVVATQTSGGITPDGYSSECQTNGVIDWSGTRCLDRLFCRMLAPNPFLAVKHDPTSVNFWNHCTFAAVLISPRHALVCQHYRGARPDAADNTSGIRFFGKGGTMYERTCTRVHLSVGDDLTLLEFDQPFPDADVRIYNRIANPRYIPKGTAMWTKDSNGKVYKTLYQTALLNNGKDVSGYGFKPCIDGVNDGASNNGWVAFFVGDSGSPVMVRDQYGESVFVGLQYGGQCINDACFATLSGILSPFGYKLDYVKLSAKAEDINQDGSVDAADIAQMLAGWGGRNPLLDLDGNFRVDAPDLSKLLAAWGSYPMQTNTQAPPPPPRAEPPIDPTQSRNQVNKRRI